MAKAETLALLGSESLLGREIRDLFSTSGFPADLRLISSEPEAAIALTELKGEPVLAKKLEEESLRGVRCLLLAGSPESARKAIELDAGVDLIDLTYSTEEIPSARLRAPMVATTGYDGPDDTVHVIAHPAAIAIALFLDRLHVKFPVLRSVINVFEPASERGSGAIEELQQQTVNLLSFKGLPKAVFDAQLAYNVLARYGEDAPVALEEVELRIERHLATLLSLSSRAPLPSLRLFQAPVFHGHTFSLWVEFETNPGVDALERVLAFDPIELRSSDLEPPSIAGIAGQGGVSVGAITMDRNHPQACWFWMVADNLRLMAENALAVARKLMEGES